MEMGAGDSYRELDEKGEVQPLHELWEGDNNFCCDGRCMLGPSLGHLAFVLILALGSTGYFVAVMCVRRTPARGSHGAVGARGPGR